MLGWLQDTSNSGYKCTFLSSTWITSAQHQCWTTLNEFSEMLLRCFLFHTLGFSEWSAGNCSNESHEMWPSAKEPESPVQMCITEVSSSVTNTLILLTLSQHQPLLYKKNPTWQKSSWISVKRRRQKSNRPAEQLIEGWGQVIACSHQN